MPRKVGPPFGSKNRESHGLAGTRVYKIWQNMKRRCDSPKAAMYLHYGGRGISYDSRWAKFEEFFKDMGSTYSDNLTIERIDINKNYCKDNCKWIPMSEQKNNTSKSRWITIDGVTKTMRDWVRESDVKRQTVAQRIDVYGWEPKRALGFEE